MCERGRAAAVIALLSLVRYASRSAWLRAGKFALARPFGSPPHKNRKLVLPPRAAARNPNLKVVK